MNQHEIIPTPHYYISMNKKKMKLRLIAITITLSSQPDLGTFSLTTGIYVKSNFRAVLRIYHLGTLQSSVNTTSMQGKKMKHRKTLKIFSKVIRSLTKQETWSQI